MKSIAIILTLLAAAGCGDTTYVFDDVGVGDDQAGRTPKERSDAQFIRAVYADLVGRSTESYEIAVSSDGTEVFRFPIDEQQALEGLLGGLGDGRPLRRILVAGLVEHAEVDVPEKADVDDPEDFIREQFRHFLGREPSVWELDRFAREWESDAAVGPKTVIRALIGSREYQSQ